MSQDVAIASRLVGFLHLSAKGASGGKHGIDRLEGPIRYLRIEEDNGHPNQVQAHKKEVCPELQLGEPDGVDENCPTNPNSPSSNTKSIALSTHL